MAEALNYAKAYSQALAQAYPYVLNFGDLYATPNNGKYRWLNEKSIEIPVLKTTGRVDGTRDTIGQFARNFENEWEPKTLTNHREWGTLVHPQDISQTDMVTSIANITQVFNEEQKFPEMDAYLISKIYADWTALGKAPIKSEVTIENILATFDNLMLKMTESRVPENGRILYVTPSVATTIKSAKEISRSIDIKDVGTSINRRVSDIDNVKIITVPKELMKTAYDFTTGWKAGASAKQVHMFLVHPNAVITPVSYQFARLDQPSAGSKGKFIYFEESFEDVFILNKKADAIQLVLEADAGA